MKKRFLKPIKFLKKYERKTIDFTVYYIEYLKSKSKYKIVLSCDNDYTIIYSNTTSTDFGSYLTFCLFNEEDKIVGCYFDNQNTLYINRDKSQSVIEMLMDSGVPLL